MPWGSKKDRIVLARIGMYIRVRQDRKSGLAVRLGRDDIDNLSRSAWPRAWMIKLTVVLRYTPASDSSSISLKIRQLPPWTACAPLVAIDTPAPRPWISSIFLPYYPVSTLDNHPKSRPHIDPGTSFHDLLDPLVSHSNPCGPISPISSRQFFA